MLVLALLVAGCSASHPTRVSATSAEPEVRHLALVSARTGTAKAVPDLALDAAVADGRRGWFVGGGIGLARLRPDGRLDRRWGTQQSRAIIVCELVRAGSRLYVEGSRGIQAFDATTAALLWTGPRTPRRGFAFCGEGLPLAATSARVYVGGLGSRPLAALDARTGRPLDWQMPRLGNARVRAEITAIAVAGSRLFVGGRFVAVGGKARYNLAALDARTGALTSWKPEATGDVDAVLVTHGQVISGNHNHFAVMDARTGRLVAWRSRVAGSPSVFAADGPLLYLGGDLQDALQQVDGVNRNNLAAFDLARRRFTSWAPDLAPFVSVGTIVPSGGKILVLGAFTESIG